MQLSGNLTRVRDGSCQAVELGHHQGVPFADGREGLIQAGAVAIAPGETVVSVDALGIDAEADQRFTLCRQVLFVGGAASISDADVLHGQIVR